MTQIVSFTTRLLTVFALLLAFGGAASAHAALNSTTPSDGAVLQTAPATFSLTFSEPVSILALNLVRPDGKASSLDRFDLKGTVLDVTAPADIGEGTHVLTWRVVSGDGHPIGGSVVFSIGQPGAQAPVVRDDVDWTIRSGLWLSKIALYVGLFIGIGGVFATTAFLPETRHGRTVLGVALGIGSIGAIGSVGLQGLDALALPVDRILEPIVWSTGFGTSYGRTVTAALIAFTLAIAALSVSHRRLQAVMSTAALAVAGAALALSGHASAASPQWMMRPAVFLHAATIAIWVGALVPLGSALRRGEPGAVEALRRFSRLIPYAVAVLLVSGTVLAVVQIVEVSALFSTAYGKVFVIKLLLLAGLFTLAAVNRWALTGPTEAGETAATHRLVRAIAVETALALLIFGAAATWRFTPPPRALAAATQQASTHLASGKAMADVTVTPGRAGPVDVSAIIMTIDFGPLDAREVSFVFSHSSAGIEPFKRRAEKPGDGTWRAEDVVLPFDGEWNIGIDILVTDFDLVKLDGTVVLKQ